jgi:hypothetical protein
MPGRVTQAPGSSSGHSSLPQLSFFLPWLPEVTTPLAASGVPLPSLHQAGSGVTTTQGLGPGKIRALGQGHVAEHQADKPR